MNKHTITQFRASHNLSGEELLELMNAPISYKALSHYETGIDPMPKWFRESLEKLIEEFGIDEKYAGYKGSYRKRVPRGKYKEKETVQAVELPPASNHYNAGQLEHIDPIKFGLANFSEEENLGFYRINAIKYISRFGKKDGFNMADLDKAIYYINKMKEVKK